MRETLEQLVARINASAYIPPVPLDKRKRVMAKQVKMAKGKEFTFKSAGSAGTPAKYPWDAWFNGDLLLLEKDTVDAEGKTTHKKDYDVPTNSMPGKIKSAARKRYKIVQISRLDADGNKLGDALIIRARDMTAEERQAEDVLRAEEKAERKAAAAAESNGSDTAAAPAAPATTQAVA